MTTLYAIVLILSGLFFGWSGWTVVRAGPARDELQPSPYRTGRFNRSLLTATAWLAVLLGPAIVLVGAFILGKELSA